VGKWDATQWATKIKINPGKCNLQNTAEIRKLCQVHIAFPDPFLLAMPLYYSCNMAFKFGNMRGGFRLNLRRFRTQPARNYLPVSGLTSRSESVPTTSDITKTWRFTHKLFRCLLKLEMRPHRGRGGRQNKLFWRTHISPLPSTIRLQGGLICKRATPGNNPEALASVVSKSGGTNFQMGLSIWRLSPSSRSLMYFPLRFCRFLLQNRPSQSAAHDFMSIEAESYINDR